MKYCIGSIHKTTNYGDLVIVDVFGRKATIMFIETGTIVEDVWKTNIAKGKVMDRYKPTNMGVGYMGMEYIQKLI